MDGKAAVKEGKKTLFVFVAEEKQEKFKTINVIHDSFGRDAFYLQEF